MVAYFKEQRVYALFAQHPGLEPDMYAFGNSEHLLNMVNSLGDDVLGWEIRPINVPPNLESESLSLIIGKGILDLPYPISGIDYNVFYPEGVCNMYNSQSV